ncbi:MAG: hypothetical protein LUG49_02645 [Oscillospiraceae bacterium]|nr:hypothetical protein [Oscillospiraceae bacterium]
MAKDTSKFYEGSDTVETTYVEPEVNVVSLEGDDSVVVTSAGTTLDDGGGFSGDLPECAKE